MLNLRLTNSDSGCSSETALEISELSSHSNITLFLFKYSQYCYNQYSADAMHGDDCGASTLRAMAKNDKIVQLG